MKLLTVLILCGLSVAQPSGKKLTSQEIIRMCTKENPISQDDVSKMEKGIATQNAKCFFKCTWEKEGVIEFGDLVEENAYPKCRHVTGSDACDLAYNYNKCIEAVAAG